MHPRRGTPARSSGAPSLSRVGWCASASGGRARAREHSSSWKRSNRALCALDSRGRGGRVGHSEPFRGNDASPVCALTNTLGTRTMIRTLLLHVIVVLNKIYVADVPAYSNILRDVQKKQTLALVPSQNMLCSLYTYIHRPKAAYTTHTRGITSVVHDTIITHPNPCPSTHPLTHRDLTPPSSSSRSSRSPGTAAPTAPSPDRARSQTEAPPRAPQPPRRPARPQARPACRRSPSTRSC